MKKLLAVVLSALMLVSGFAMTVSADIIYNDTELDWGAYVCSVVVGSAEGKVGDTISIPVEIKNNPGIVSIKLAVAYDATQLELVDVEAGSFGSTEGEVPTLSFGPTENNPFIINWIDPVAEVNNKEVGNLAVLNFKIKEGAEGTSAISVSCNPNDVFNNNLKNVDTICTAGAATVKTHTPGDVTDDGKINIRDLGLLQQYLNGWDVTVNLDACDVTGDGKVNIRDLGLLQQYLNGWDVKLV